VTPLPAAASALASTALKYAAYGWAVFPLWNPLPDGSCACTKGALCERSGKHPLARLAPNGLLDATKDEAIISGWWTSYPNANIAIRCGEESGLVVLDIDAYRGGVYSFEDLESQHGRVPYSIRAKTGSGGGSSHIYLAHPRDGRRISSNASGKLGAGLDVKADGGYVVAPPSLHASGGRYIWLDTDNSHLEPAPAWLLNLLGSTNSTPENPINTGIELPEEDAKRLADEWFAKAAARVEAGSPRHDTWVWFVIQMKDSAVPLAVTKQYVDEFLHVAGELGSARNVTEQELRAALAWAYGKARRDPLPAARRALDDQRLRPEEGEEKPAPEPGANPYGSGVYDVGRILGKSRAGESRFLTGIATLDQRLTLKSQPLNVGIPLGRILGIQGAPSAGKSMMLGQVSLELARQGLRVGMFVTDEAREDAAERIGQQLGFKHAELNAEHPRTISTLIESATNLDIALFPDDETDENPTLEDGIKALLSVKNEKGYVLSIDSLHRVHCEKETGRDDPRIQIKKRMDTLRRLIREHRDVLAIYTAEVSRGAYANRDEAKRTSPEAAGAEGRDFEYASSTILFLMCQGDSDVVNVTISKNKIGRHRTPFAMQRHEGSASFKSITDEMVEVEEEEKKNAALMPIVEKIVALLVSKNGAKMSARAIEDEMGGSKITRDALRLASKLGRLKYSETKNRQGTDYWAPTDTTQPLDPILDWSKT
jgi:KaiC/GvpD/RAD55 family RecA-like ATPase